MRTRAPGPLVSVVVPTRGRPRLLRRCLAGLLLQDFPRDAYEVVVVADGPDAQARAEAQRARRPGAPGVRFLELPEPAGPAAARNRGWRAGAAPLLAFTDDDTIPAAGWLREGVRALALADAAAGRARVPLPATPTDHERDAAGLDGAEFVTASCFVRRAALAAVGGFDERYRLAWREDSDLQFALLERGLRVARAPGAMVLHPVRPASWGESLRRQRRVAYDALLYRKHPRLFRERIRRQPPWHYVAAVAALATAAAAGAAGQGALALAALALWLAVTLRFCWRRLRGASRAPAHVVEMLVTSAAIPPLALYWRARGALRFGAWFP